MPRPELPLPVRPADYLHPVRPPVPVQPALLGATLARAVGANSEGGDQPEQAIIVCLRDKHMLLVLDNF